MGKRAPLNELTTTRDVLDALGGISAVAKLLGKRYTAVHNWAAYGAFPASTFVVLTAALKRAGYVASPTLWPRMDQAAE